MNLNVARTSRLHGKSSAMWTSPSWTPRSPSWRLWEMGEQQHPAQLYPLHFLTYQGEQSPRQSLQQEITTDHAAIAGLDAIHWLSNWAAMRKSWRC